MALRSVFTLILLWATSAANVANSADPEMADLTIDTRHRCVALHVELATSTEARRAGLQHRTSLPEHGGMLFINPQSRITVMWMKDTPMSLDMVFINTDGKIVRIAERTTPQSLKRISSGVPVKAVLEIKAGRADDLGIKVGDEVSYGLSK